MTFNSKEEIDPENIVIGGVDPTLQEAESEQEHPRDRYDLRKNTQAPERYGDRAHMLGDVGHVKRVGTEREPNLEPKPSQGQRKEQEKEHKRGNNESPLFPLLLYCQI